MNILNIITLLFCVLIILFFIRENKINYLFLIISIIIVSIPAIIKPNAITFGHDLWMHLYRIKGLVLNFTEFNIPYRINNYTFNSYGSQEPIFYPYLMLIIPSIIIKIFNISIISSLNATIILINTLSGIFMYKCVFNIYKNKTKALIASVFYILALYRVGNIYTRNAFGEMFAMAFIPIYIYSLYELLYGNYNKYKYFIVGSSLIFMSHILSTVFAILLFVLLFILNIKKIITDKKRLITILKSIIIIIIMNAWYLFPLIYEYFNIYVITPFKTEKNPIAWQNFNILSYLKIFYNHETYNGIGINILIGLIFVFIYYIKKIFSRFKFNFNFNFNHELFIILTLILIFMFIPYENLNKIFLVNKLVNKMQFSFRLLILFIPILSILFSYTIDELIKNKKILLFFVFFISIISTGSYLYNVVNNGYFKYDDSDYIYINEYCLGETSLNKNYYLESSDTLDEDLFTNDILSSKNITVSNIKKMHNGISIDYIINTESDESFIEFPIFAYPNYVAYDENKNRLKIHKGFNNKIKINTNKKNGAIKVIQQELSFWLIGDLLTLILILYFVFLEIKIIYKKFFKIFLFKTY